MYVVVAVLIFGVMDWLLMHKDGYDGLEGMVVSNMYMG